MSLNRRMPADEWKQRRVSAILFWIGASITITIVSMNHALPQSSRISDSAVWWFAMAGLLTAVIGIAVRMDGRDV